MIFALLYYILPIVLTCFAAYGEPDDESATAVAVSFIPGIGAFIGVIALFSIVSRAYRSKGKCKFGHSYIEKTNSHNRNIKMRIPISRWGASTYKCTKCKDDRFVRWNAY